MHKLVNEPTEDNLVNLQHLVQLPAWQLLRLTVVRKMKNEFMVLANDLMEGRPVQSSDVAYKRGFYAGMKFVLDQPDLEIKAMEKVMSNGSA